MAYTKEQIRIAILLADFSHVYVKTYLSPTRFKDQFKDNYASVYNFLYSNAFERYRAPSAFYREVATGAIQQVFGGVLKEITPKEIKKCWRVCRKEARGRKLNATHFPLNSQSGTSSNRSLLTVMMEENILNLATWSKRRLSRGETEKAHRTLKHVRGIGRKIASFYLRDIAFLSKVSKDSIQDLHLLQPIDIWVNRALEEVMGTKAGMDFSSPDSDYWMKARMIADLCEHAECSSIAFNMGAWVLGSRISGGDMNFRRILRDKKHKIVASSLGTLQEKAKKVRNGTKEEEMLSSSLKEVLSDL